MSEAAIEQLALYAVLGVVVIVFAAGFSRRLGVAAPLILVLVGVGVSFIPGVPLVRVAPDLILLAVLPPLLYSAAIQLPVVDFRRELASISALSVLLVVISAVVTGFALYTILPDLNLAAAIAVGAVISPTDVVAATSIGQRLGLPPRVLTIIQGEGLVNDATALVLLRSAIAAGAASMAGSFDIGGAVLDFGYAAAVAIALGIVVGIISVAVRSRLRDPVLDTAVSLVVPFAAFVPAEQVNASGVLAVVVTGLISGAASPRRFSAQFRISERLNWRTIQFVLENGVFLLMGLELKAIVDEVHRDDLSATLAVALGLLCVAILLGVRMLAMGPLVAAIRFGQSRIEHDRERLATLQERVRSPDGASARTQRLIARRERHLERRDNDLRQQEQEKVDWRAGIVIGWAGMRGVVTLAAAQSLPRETDYHPLLVLVAFTVAIVTLLLYGGTLPLVIRLTGIRGSDRAVDRSELADLLDEIRDAGLDSISGDEVTLPDGEVADADVVDRVRHDTGVAADIAREGVDSAARDRTSERAGPHVQYRILRGEVLRAERDALLDARARNAYPTRILRRAQSLLDLEETRLDGYTPRARRD